MKTTLFCGRASPVGATSAAAADTECFGRFIPPVIAHVVHCPVSAISGRVIFEPCENNSMQVRSRFRRTASDRGPSRGCVADDSPFEPPELARLATNRDSSSRTLSMILVFLRFPVRGENRNPRCLTKSAEESVCNHYVFIEAVPAHGALGVVAEAHDPTSQRLKRVRCSDGFPACVDCRLGSRRGVSLLGH